MTVTAAANVTNISAAILPPLSPMSPVTAVAVAATAAVRLRYHILFSPQRMGVVLCM